MIQEYYKEAQLALLYLEKESCLLILQKAVLTYLLFLLSYNLSNVIVKLLLQFLTYIFLFISDLVYLIWVLTVFDCFYIMVELDSLVWQNKVAVFSYLTHRKIIKASSFSYLMITIGSRYSDLIFLSDNNLITEFLTKTRLLVFSWNFLISYWASL